MKMPDIPISSGPAPSMPDWARETLIAMHRGIVSVYNQLGMSDVAALHAGEIHRLQNLEAEVSALAEQLRMGWQVPIAVVGCPHCNRPLMRTFEGECRSCGKNPDVIVRSIA